MWRDCARWVDLMISDIALPLAMAASCLLPACGDGGPAGPEQVERRSDFTIAAAPAGLEAAVVADSIGWAPGVFRVIGDDELEIDGTYLVTVRNVSAQPLELRYDLRFLDVDGIFVDRFIPFGQPLRLESGVALTELGSFSIRSQYLSYPELLATMQVVVTITAPDE